MSNVYKSGFIQLSTNNTRVIDGNALAAKHIEEHSSVFRELSETFTDAGEASDGDGFEPGIPMDALTALTVPTGNSEGTVLAAADAEEGFSLNPDEVRLECDEMISRANAMAEQIREEAKKEAEAIKQQAALDGYAEGKAAVEAEYANAIEEANQKLNNELVSLQQQFEQIVKNVEPQMIEVITGLYRRIFGEGLYDCTKVLTHLINKALLKQEADDEVTIFVSEDDYEDLIANKESIFKRISMKTEPRIVVREDFEKGNALIETAYGIIDCGIETELTELSRALILLSEKE